MSGLRHPGAAVDLADAAAVDVFADKAETVEWRGRRALRVENGLVLVKDVAVGDGAVEVDLWAGPGPAYPGIAFRAADELDHELVYVQPHTSGSWDAVQYDPVFNGDYWAAGRSWGWCTFWGSGGLRPFCTAPLGRGSCRLR